MPNVNPFHGNDKPLPADNYILKVNNRNTRTRSEIYSKKEWNILTLCSSVITVNFEHVIAGWAKKQQSTNWLLAWNLSFPDNSWEWCISVSVSNSFFRKIYFRNLVNKFTKGSQFINPLIPGGNKCPFWSPVIKGLKRFMYHLELLIKLTMVCIGFHF